MNKAKTLLAAGIIGLSPIANASNTWTEVENTTNKDLTEVLDTSNKENIDGKTISREEAQKIAKDAERKVIIKNEISSNIDNMEDFIKHYWKEVVKEKISDIIETISTNPDKYWSFDSEWSFQLNEEKTTPLIEETFKEAIKQDKNNNIINMARLIWMLARAISWIGIWIKIEKKRQENL